MSLYNILHGECKNAARLQEILKLQNYNVGRYRDIGINEDGTEILMLTRNGGGNREHDDYDEKKEGPNCYCTGCIITYHIPKHPNYLRDYDDDFDCTYAYVAYSVPDEYKEEIKAMVKKDGKMETIGEKFTPEKMEKIIETMLK